MADGCRRRWRRCLFRASWRRTNDPLARFARVEALATAWGSRLVDVGAVGHLNPVSGYGPWPQAETLLRQLA